MGYRSDVVIALSNEVYLDSVLKKNLPRLLQDSHTEIIKSKAVSAYIFVMESLKWYESYPDVDGVENYLLELDEADYGLTRVGENDSDIENKGTPWDYDIWVSREIAYPLE